MFQDCLSVRLSYKNRDGTRPWYSARKFNFLTLSLKNLGDYGLNLYFNYFIDNAVGDKYNYSISVY